ncbi:Disease resistance protein [Melia azedarach]|uniref:Disease resistance protein n=1 Tax=Melia azedarach TaxID=155640 RepID=A0ACC1X038_MELAZ|nr:Disease resistance protein [Melia azedarach]
MNELRVIDFDRINLLSLPSSFGYLINLSTLCLDDCLLGDITVIGELKNLEILSFSRSNIELLPGEIGQLIQLKLLDLSKCSKLKVITPNVISSLCLLEELYLDDSFVQWEDGLSNQDQSNTTLSELNQLSHLTTWNICIPDAQIMPQDLFFQQLTRYRILIGDAWSWSYSSAALRTLKLKLNHSNYLGYGMKMLLKISI